MLLPVVIFAGEAPVFYSMVLGEDEGSIGMGGANATRPPIHTFIYGALITVSSF